jgi:hypothetical protein
VNNELSYLTEQMELPTMMGLYRTLSSSAPVGRNRIINGTTFTKYLKFNPTTGADNCGIWQTIEDVDSVQGTYTLSFYAKGTNPAGGSIGISLSQSATAWTLDITGVQLETGTTATDFEHLQYGQQMQLCQRYFYSLGGTASYEFMTYGMYVGTTTPLLRAELPVKMRAAPTLGSTGTFLAKSGNSNLACASFSVDQAATQTFSFSATISGGSSTEGYATLMFANASTATRLTFSAEL